MKQAQATVANPSMLERCTCCEWVGISNEPQVCPSCSGENGLCLSRQPFDDCDDFGDFHNEAPYNQFAKPRRTFMIGGGDCQKYTKQGNSDDYQDEYKNQSENPTIVFGDVNFTDNGQCPITPPILVALPVDRPPAPAIPVIIPVVDRHPHQTFGDFIEKHVMSFASPGEDIDAIGSNLKTLSVDGNCILYSTACLTGSPWPLLVCV